MGEGKGLRLYMLIGAIMLGLFAGTTVIFGEEVGAFEGGLVEDDSKCVLATDEDFGVIDNGYFSYIGSDECVKIPHVIKGVEVTSYTFMFTGTSVSKVVSDNPNVTDMSWMFYGSQAPELDLSSFDTSKVTDMWAMFYGSEATELDLSSFDTSNVTGIMGMSRMFSESQAKTVYARTQADADEFNESSNKPNGLQVIVKDREPNEGIVEDDPNCVLATDEDFSVIVNGKFMYIGSDDCVKIPHVIKGVEVTSYTFMFTGTSVSKVVSDNPNVTDMRGMFIGSNATELDLSSFNTSNVTDMSSMFSGSEATELDLSSFDTSNVTDMWNMFDGSQATELDLSSFDTSNVTDMEGMFAESQATTVYARTQVDADKLYTTSYKPIGLQVVLKQ